MNNDQEIVQTDISALVLERCYQARERMDEGVIEGYAEVLRQAGRWTFPPIMVVNSIVVDGHHRLEAVKHVINDPETPSELKKALRSIPCERVKVDPTCKDVRDLALRHALAANHTHGLSRSPADKRRAVELALKAWPGESDREIAKLTGTSHPFVAKMRDQAQVETLPPQPEEESFSSGAQVETLPPSKISDGITEMPSCDGLPVGAVKTDSAQASARNPEENLSAKRGESARQTPFPAAKNRVKSLPVKGLIERSLNQLADLNKAATAAGKQIGTKGECQRIRRHLKAINHQLAAWSEKAESVSF